MNLSQQGALTNRLMSHFLPMAFVLIPRNAIIAQLNQMG